MTILDAWHSKLCTEICYPPIYAARKARAEVAGEDDGSKLSLRDLKLHLAARHGLGRIVALYHRSSTLYQIC